MAENQTIKMVFHNTFSNRSNFELLHGSRPWNAFLILTEGSFTCKLNGKEYFFEKDEIAYFPQNVHFERRVLSPIGFHQFGFFIQESTPYTDVLKEGKLNIPKEHVRSIIETLDIVAQYFLHDAKPIFYHIISNIIMENYIFSAKDSHAPVKQDNDIAYVIQYMSEHLSEKINIEELAAELHLSHIGLLWKFKKKMNCTPSEFLIRLRMQYAKQLVLEEKMRINEIAQLCGYNNAYYFSNAFKKYFRLSPSQYREKMKKT